MTPLKLGHVKTIISFISYYNYYFYNHYWLYFCKLYNNQ